jgi:spermidine/putrescine transport system permease protein
VSTATATARRTGRGSGRGAGRGAGRGPGRWLADHLVLVLGLLVLVYMTVPVLVVMLMSFNDPASRNSYSFDGFTLANWTDVCGPYQLCESLVTSLQIGLLATLGATLLGTLMAFAMVRHRFRGRSAANLLIFLPMATPEVVMGSSLLALFVNVGVAGFLGFWTILVAHVLFCLSFVVVTVKARLAGLDPRLEQAAMDLYANEWQTFWRISFPLVFPGILGAALLSFSLSFDDFIITNLNAGQEVTFPMFVWGAAQRGIPPQINVVGTIMFLVAMSVVLVGELGSRRRAGR